MRLTWKQYAEMAGDVLAIIVASYFGKWPGFALAVVVIFVVYTLFSAMVAVSTADKCNGQLRADKEWNFVPPRWDCVSTLPGQGG